ncbi:MAG TPA: HlyD family efflux transporter periplasmic adaptor subunit [Gemmatimonadales bacterium]|nr:HlyD family efflux transporter periplasmic adaptor subunit [Gemmatimonadales bacterium]
MLATVVAGCADEPEADAYGNFEATEVTVSAETSGRIEEFHAVEGMRLERGDVAAVIDTSQLALELTQLEAQRSAVASRSTEVVRQIRVLDVQRDVARRAYERAQRLHAQSAGTAAQLDRAEREHRALEAQIGALEAQRQTVGSDAAAADARIAQLKDRMARARVANPVGGTVLAAYARAGEVVQPGTPLYRVADLDTLELRAYVTGPQLAAVRLGQRVTIRLDAAGGELAELPGIVSWIASAAEFTPTPIQTREDRADLVYAVKIRVPNRSGMLKIGMPADVTWETGSGAAAAGQGSR